MSDTTSPYDDEAAGIDELRDAEFDTPEGELADQEWEDEGGATEEGPATAEWQ